MEDGRRYRGIIGLAAVWAVSLSALATSSLALGLATGLVPGSIFGARELVAVVIRGLLAGGVAGGLFGWLLSTREQRATLSTLSPGRVGRWGFVAGASVPALMVLAAGGPVLPLGVLGAAIVGAGIGGSVLARGTLSVARGKELKQIGDPDEDSNRLLP
jgi:hypothetical protein